MQTEVMGALLRLFARAPDYFAIPLYDGRVSLASLILLSFFMTSLCGLAAFLRPLYILPARLFPNVTHQHRSGYGAPQ
jgi:hypothetical protein